MIFKIALFFRMNCLNRANICARTTVGANIRIDLINIPFGNCLNGAFVDTGTASSAIFVDFVSHVYDF